MGKVIHQNYIKASNLTFLSGLMGIVNIFFLPEILASTIGIVTIIVTFAFVIGLGFLIRQGFDWVKYLLLFLMIFGLIGIQTIIKNLSENPIVGIINIIQTILQFWALILVFKISKTDKEIE